MCKDTIQRVVSLDVNAYLTHTDEMPLTKLLVHKWSVWGESIKGDTAVSADFWDILTKLRTTN